MRARGSAGSGGAQGPGPRRRQQLALAGILGAIVLLALIAGPRGGAPEGDPRPSTYLSSAEGTRALYLLLERLEIPVDRLRAPWGDNLDPATLLVVLAPTLPPEPAAVAALSAWVEGGGTLVLVADTGSTLVRTLVPSDDLHGTPSTLPRTLPRGLGRVVHFPDVAPFRNGALREDPVAAERLVTVVRRRGSPAGPVLFDEYVHGFRGEGSPARALRDFFLATAWGRWALQALLGSLLLLVALGARFGAPFPPPPPPLRTPLEHAEALAGVYRKAGAFSTARRNLLAGLARRLGIRVGTLLPEGEAGLALPPALRELPSAPALEAAWLTPDEAGLVALARAGDALEAERRRPTPPTSTRPSP